MTETLFEIPLDAAIFLDRKNDMAKRIMDWKATKTWATQGRKI